MSKNSPAIFIEGLYKSYTGKAALNHIDLAIGAGERVGIVGVNGAGKTTLIKSVLDLCRIGAGRITVLGVDHRDPKARAEIAYLPERFQPPAYLTGREFLRYILSLRCQDYCEQQVLDVLEALDGDDAMLAKPVRHYSKGMAQKLGLAACFLSGKRVYILDEPMSGLDPKARALFKRQLNQCLDGSGTLLMSSHLLADVEQLCERILVLNRGELAFDGSSEEFVERFRSHDLDNAFLECIGAHSPTWSNSSRVASSD